MSPSTRKLVAKLHLWLGLPAAAVLAVVALTGAVLVFEKDLDRAWHPELWQMDAAAPALPLDTLDARAREAAPGYALKEVRLAPAGEPVEFRFEKGPHVRLDPATGAVLGTRARGDSFFGAVERVHTSLVLGEVGHWIVAGSSIALLVLLATGLVLWWPKQWRQLKAAITLALGRRGRALHFNLHNTLGFWSALPLCAIALTGAIMSVKPLGDALRRVGGTSAEMLPPTATSDPALSAASLDRLAAAARTAFPDAQQLRLHAPRALPATRADDAAQSRIKNPKSKMPAEGGVWRIEAVLAGTPHEHARSRAYLDPRSADVLRIDRFADLPLGQRLRALARPIHDGSILGRPTQVIALLSVLILLILSVTGTALWLLKRRAQQTRKNRITDGLPASNTAPAPAALVP